MNTLGKSFDWKKFLLFVQLLYVIVAPVIMFFCFTVVALAMFGSKAEGQGIIASYFVVSVVGFTLLLLDSYLNADYSHLRDVVTKQLGDKAFSCHRACAHGHMGLDLCA